MQNMVIMFRAAEREIEYKDHGVDHETNSHDVDWWFKDREFNDEIEVTDDEHEEVYNKILKHSADMQSDELG